MKINRRSLIDSNGAFLENHPTLDFFNKKEKPGSKSGGCEFILKKTLFLFIFMCFSLWVAAGFASQKIAPLLNDPLETTGLEWGSPPEDVDSMISYKISSYMNEFYDWKVDGFGFADRFFDDDWKKPLLDGKRESYIKKNDELRFEMISLLKTVYSYSSGNLSEITMLFKGEEIYQSIEEFCQINYGPSQTTKCPPTFGAVGRLQTDQFWEGEKTLVHLRWDHILFTDKTFGFLQFRSKKHLE